MRSHQPPSVWASIGAALVAVAMATAAPVVAARAPEDVVLAMLNGERTAHGLPPLVPNPGATAVAREWSAAMAASGRVFHNPRLEQQLRDGVGAGWQRFAENVGSGADAGSIHGAFMASAAHRDNILGGYNQVGVGTASANGLLWVTVDFVQAPEPPPPPPEPPTPPTPPPPPPPAPPMASPPLPPALRSALPGAGAPATPAPPSPAPQRRRAAAPLLPAPPPPQPSATPADPAPSATPADPAPASWGERREARAWSNQELAAWILDWSWRPMSLSGGELRFPGRS